MKLWIGIAFAVLLGVLAVCLLPFRGQLKVTPAPNCQYQFTLVKITTGTNHVVYNGSSAVVKRALAHSPLRSLCRFFPRTLRSSYWHEKASTTNTTVLWICWTRPGYNYRPDSSGVPGPTHLGLPGLECVMCEPNGRSHDLGMGVMPFASSEAPFIKEITEAWCIPPDVTNLSGCQMRLLTGNKEEVATVVLQ